MPLGWEHDEDLVDLPDGAVLLFLKLVSLSQTTGSGGRLTWAQVQTVARSVSRGRHAVERLMSRGCLVVDSPMRDGCTSVVISKRSRWLLDVNPPKAIPAAQEGSLRANGEPGGKTSRARREREEREKESIRSPSGSDRMDSARAVPRDAGGAARPAPVADPPAGDTVVGDDLTNLSRAEKIAAARKAIREGQRKGPATGRDISFSRYDPNRQIIPLKSGFTVNGGEE